MTSGVPGTMCLYVLGADKNRDGLGKGTHRREESRVSHQDLLRALGMGQKVSRGHNKSSAAELGIRLGDWI